MEKHTGKRTAKRRLRLTKRAIEALEPSEKSFIAWDNKLTGFGVRVQPSGIKSFILNYRAGDGGRRASNKRMVIGRYGAVTPDKARRLAQELLGHVAGGSDPASDRSKARRMPTLAEAFDDYMRANPNRAPKTVVNYRHNFRNGLSDWLARPLDAIARRDVEDRFHRITERHGWATANQTLSMLRSVYRRPCVDHEGLRNPVELWLVGGGRFHRPRRRRISAPAEVLPRWRVGMEASDLAPVFRDIFLFGLYTGMRKGEVLALRWERVDLAERIFRVEETKTGNPLELPITRQLAAVFERRWSARGNAPEKIRCWVFPSAVSISGHLEDLHRYYEEIGEAGGTRFWFHGLRNCFITVAERELMFPRSLTKRLVNHARSSDVTEGYAADWTVEQLREPAQRIADRIDDLSNELAPVAGWARQVPAPTAPA